jgi:signal transduction histidine kinase
MRRGAKPEKAKVEARRPVVRKSPKNETAGHRELEKRLAESLEREKATSEILRVISSSPTDLQPVFDAVASSATRLCDAAFTIVFRFDGEMITVAADDGRSPGTLEVIRSAYPSPPGRQSISALAILERRVVCIADAQSSAEYPHAAERARAIGYRSILSVPMLRGDVAIGAINVSRLEAIPFTDTQIALLQTFADQAVIAIENVRLFNELEGRNRDLTQALEQQTVTAEILRVISSSPTDVQPVFDAIAASATRLCEAVNALVVRFDGQLLHLVAHHNVAPERLDALERLYPGRANRGGVSGRVVLTRAVVHVEDVNADPEYTHVQATTVGYRTALGVPMLREGVAIGLILVARDRVAPFSDKQIALLQTFADQAVIAVENVRLFNELEGKNVDLTAAHAQVTEALEQQTATAEILRVISSSPTDVQPVFDAIVESAVRLCDARYGAVFNFDGDLVHLMAHHNFSETALEGFHEQYPMRPTRAHISGRAILSGSVVQIPDVTLDPEYGSPHTVPQGFRSLLAVPILRGGAPIGAIVIYRPESGMLSDEQISLLQTFAAQAVIAIENVRLFKELQARTHELTRSVDQLTALGEISQAVSSTLDVETVLQTVVSRASQLAGADGCAIYEYDDATEAFHIRATHHLDPSLVATLRASPLRKGEGAIGRAAETREPTQVADIAVPGAYQSHIRDTLLGAGYRALLSVPLLREGEVIGSLSLNRRVPGQFPPEAVEVLKTFATQSALAIQNARLFREIADKSAQLEAASRHKSEFLANMSHELRTPLNAIIGFSEVLTERMFGELNEKQDEYLRDIYASGQHLLSLINDILDLSKIEAGRMELEATDFDVPSAIDNALTLVRERATRRGIALGRTIDERLGTIRGDERKVKQVLLNLLSNALKFTPEGGRIDVSARVQDGAAEIAVADTGVGIAPEDQEAVFEEFRQVGTADKKVEGTGLGLALSRKFIELHGGRIRVRSQVGHGSTFTFTLPVRREE